MLCIVLQEKQIRRWKAFVTVRKYSDALTHYEFASSVPIILRLSFIFYYLLDKPM